jgi:hypothetical protein
MRSKKILLVIGVAIALLLATKAFKYFLYFSFAMLSLKVVWIALIILAVALFLK